MNLDLSDLNSVRDFASEFLSKQSVLHGLVNNAGVMFTPEGKTKDGFEIQLGTNHLGHFLLTELLLPTLKQSAPSRIVILSSCYHDKAQGREGRINFEDLNFEKRKYDGWEAYAQSKLANLLHAKHLGKKLSASGVTAVSVHPGWVRTNLIRGFMPIWMQDVLLKPFLRLGGMIEPWEGAQTTLYSLLAPEVENHNGAYFSQKGIYRTKEASKGGWPLYSPNPNAHEESTAERLDQVSRLLVGL
jgi:NAD(P)-dependent dehydrogenase (short-subunit alcohol dehydrogenase family)